LPHQGTHCFRCHKNSLFAVAAAAAAAAVVAVA